MQIKFDEDELWALHEWVRRERSAPAYGEEHDLEFMHRVWRAILDLAQADTKARGGVEIELSRGEVLQITRQISMLTMAGSRPVGRDILRKAFTALLSQAEGETSNDIPDVFRVPYDDHADD